jgi:hypothetical protein
MYLWSFANDESYGEPPEGDKASKLYVGCGSNLKLSESLADVNLPIARPYTIYDFTGLFTVTPSYCPIENYYYSVVKNVDNMTI